MLKSCSRLPKREEGLPEEHESPWQILSRRFGPRIQYYRTLVPEPASQLCSRADVLGCFICLVLLDYKNLLQLDHYRADLLPDPFPSIDVVY